MEIIYLDPEGVDKYEKEANSILEEFLPSTWKGYAGLELVGRNGCEIDLVIVTSDRLIVVEHKYSVAKTIWNKDKKWIYEFDNGYQLPVSNGAIQVQGKPRKLKTRIESKLKHKLSLIPWVDKCVVLNGNINKENLDIGEQEIVFSLDEFKEVGHPDKYKTMLDYISPYFQPKELKDRPNQNLEIWDKFFLGNSANFKPKKYTFDNYFKEGSAIFQHKDKIYAEYKSFHLENKAYQAVMRCWNFSAPAIQEFAKTPEERKDLLLRESSVLAFIDSQNSDLKQVHLEYKPSSGFSADFNELYEWPDNMARLDEFIERKWSNLDKSNRVNLAKVFVSQLAELHKIKVAHRDIGSHSVWLRVPTKIVFSNFVAASYPEVDNKTIKNIRNILRHGRIILPEDLYEDIDGTSYTRDVFLAASIVHCFLFGHWPSKQEDNIYEWREVENDPFKGLFDNWFSKALNFEAKHRYPDLSIALEELNKLTSNENRDKRNSLSDFEKYYTNTNVFTDYGSADVISSKGTELLYKTNDNWAIKVWNGVNDINSSGFVNDHLLTFLNRIRNVKNADIDGVSKIKDFGFNPSIRNVFVSYEWINGSTWEEGVHTFGGEEAADIILTLLETLTLLHKNKISHGDIHPKNIVLRKNEKGEKIPVLIDLFDFSNERNTPYTKNYVPDNYEGLSLFSRDRYAVIKMAQEVFEFAQLENLHNHCSDLIAQPEVSEGDIGRLIDNYQSILKPEDSSHVDLDQVVLSSSKFLDGLTEVESVDGAYFINLNKIEADRYTEEDTLVMFFSGAKEQIKMKIGLNSKSFFAFSATPLRHEDLILNKKTAKVVLSKVRVHIVKGKNDAKEFINLLLNNKQFLKELSKLQFSDNQEKETELPESSIKEPIGKLWTKLMDTEYALYPKVALTSEPKKMGNGVFGVSFSLEQGSIKSFDSKEKVQIKKEFNGHLKYCGRVIDGLKEDSMRYRPGKFSYTSLALGDEVLLENSMAASSLSKRRKALEEIINNRCIIDNLVDYFDPNLELNPIIKDTQPSDDELDSYTEYDDCGDILFELNKSQRESFKKLYKFGPLGLLQGPPGTGKTAFIGAFIHYSINKGATSVLLVSQSHEAVNNAAEKARELFRKRDQDLSLVRLGDDEKISELLEDVTESSVQDSYRDLFKAEMLQRVKSAVNFFNIGDDFIKLSVEFEMSFAKKASSLQKHLSVSDADNEKDITNKIESLLTDALRFFNNHFPKSTVSPVIDLAGLKDEFYRLLSERFEIDSPDKIEKYRNILQISIEWIEVMSSPNSQFQNFLAKTRTLVCGTCVGIARQHYGINENIYDLVIIDEAARATAGEMAIAMQVGKKVILVGDHKQLPPQIEDAHIDAAVKELDGVSEKELRRSDFERAFLSNYGKAVGQSLSTQYRMTPAIGNLVSKCFYNGLLETGRGLPDKKLNILPESLGKTVTWFNTSKNGDSAYEISPKSQETSFENPYEAEFIIQLIRKLFESLSDSNFFNPEKGPEIGVICMYQKQKNLIKRKINSLDWARGLIENGSLMVDTVDGYQGKENSIIIASLVRNNERRVEGFLSSKNRANVAFSRAKERLYIVGAANMWLSRNSESPIGSVLSFIEEHDGKDYCIMDSEDMGRN